MFVLPVFVLLRACHECIFQKENPYPVEKYLRKDGEFWRFVFFVSLGSILPLLT